MKNSSFISLISVCAVLFLGLPAHAQAAKPGKTHKSRTHEAKPADEPEFANFAQWRGVAEVIDELSDQHGLQRETLKAQFAKVHYLENVVRLINPPPPSKVKNWTVYRERFIEPTRLRAGAACLLTPT